MADLPALGRKDFKIKKEMNLILLALMGIIFVLPNFLSCGKVTDTGHVTIFITGIIKNKLTDQPIDSAWIDTQESYTIGQHYTFSDSAGHYEFAFFLGPNHSRTIYAGKSGYLTFDTLIQFSIPQKDFDTVNIYLEPE